MISGAECWVLYCWGWMQLSQAMPLESSAKVSADRAKRTSSGVTESVTFNSSRVRFTADADPKFFQYKLL